MGNGFRGRGRTGRSFSPGISTAPPLTNLNSANQTRRWDCAENNLSPGRSANISKTLRVFRRGSLARPTHALPPRDVDLSGTGGFKRLTPIPPPATPPPDLPKTLPCPALEELSFFVTDPALKVELKLDSTKQRGGRCPGLGRLVPAPPHASDTGKRSLPFASGAWGRKQKYQIFGPRCTCLL